MIDLGNGHIYLNQGEPLPFSCPECSSPVAFEARQAGVIQLIVCPKCKHVAPWSAYNAVRWQMKEPN